MAVPCLIFVSPYGFINLNMLCNEPRWKFIFKCKSSSYFCSVLGIHPLYCFLTYSEVILYHLPLAVLTHIKYATVILWFMAGFYSHSPVLTLATYTLLCSSPIAIINLTESTALDMILSILRSTKSISKSRRFCLSYSPYGRTIAWNLLGITAQFSSLNAS